MKTHLKTMTTLLAYVYLSIYCQHTWANSPNSSLHSTPLQTMLSQSISLQTLIDDVTYLASDELKGRASFSPEIDQAANYISKRFKEIGLVSGQNTSNYQQQFSLFNITPNALSVEINQQVLDTKNITMASSHASFSWQKHSDTTLHVVGESDNVEVALSGINQQGGQHLILMHTSHQASFLKYQRYFSRGLSKLTLANQGAIVLALTNKTKVNSFRVQGQSNITKKLLTNVVGILPGKSKPDEIVLYSSHYDHLGVNPKNSEQIFNGANDNASGTSAVISLAQYFAKQNNNERTLMFAAFTAEEIGGFGSLFFSKQLLPEKIIAMINIEMIGKPSKFGAGTLWMTGIERSNLGTLLNQKLKKVNSQIHADPYPNYNLFYRSDNATLARLGVPAHSFSSSKLDKDQHYHQVTDDITHLNFSSMLTVVETLAVGTQGLVNGTLTPSRVDITQVKAKGLIY